MNGRVYDPRIGRFVSPDPVIPNPAFSQSYNRYAYVHNNPLSYTDPTGYNPFKKAWKGIKKAFKNAFKKVMGILKDPMKLIETIIHIAIWVEGGWLGNLVLSSVVASAGATARHKTSQARARAQRRAGVGEGGGTPGIAGPAGGFGLGPGQDGMAHGDPWWLRWVPMRIPGSGVQSRSVGDPRQVRDGDPEWIYEWGDSHIWIVSPIHGALLRSAIRALVVTVAGETKMIRARVGWQPTILVQDYELFVYLQYVILDPNDTGGIIGGPRAGIGPGEDQTRVIRKVQVRRENSRGPVFVYDVCLLRRCWSNVR